MIYIDEESARALIERVRHRFPISDPERRRVVVVEWVLVKCGVEPSGGVMATAARALVERAYDAAVEMMTKGAERDGGA